MGQPDDSEMILESVSVSYGKLVFIHSPVNEHLEQFTFLIIVNMGIWDIGNMGVFSSY
jgi:hypothetical protein